MEWGFIACKEGGNEFPKRQSGDESRQFKLMPRGMPIFTPKLTGKIREIE